MFERQRVRNFSEMSRWPVDSRTVERIMKRLSDNILREQENAPLSRVLPLLSPPNNLRRQGAGRGFFLKGRLFLANGR